MITNRKPLVDFVKNYITQHKVSLIRVNLTNECVYGWESTYFKLW